MSYFLNLFNIACDISSLIIKFFPIYPGLIWHTLNSIKEFSTYWVRGLSSGKINRGEWGKLSHLFTSAVLYARKCDTEVKQKFLPLCQDVSCQWTCQKCKHDKRQWIWFLRQKLSSGSTCPSLGASLFKSGGKSTNLLFTALTKASF